LPFTTRNFVIATLTLSLPDFDGVAAEAAGATASNASRQSRTDLRM
jgi:hypothetical protein